MRPLAYPDSDAVLICFDISRPETLDSVIKKVSFWCDLISLCMRQHLSSAVTLRDVFFCPDQHLLLTRKSALGSLHFHGPVTEQMGTGVRKWCSFISLKRPWIFDPGRSEERTIRICRVSPRRMWGVYFHLIWGSFSLEKGFRAEKLLSTSGVVEFNVGIVNWGVVLCRGSPIVVINVVLPRRHVEPPSLMGETQA